MDVGYFGPFIRVRHMHNSLVRDILLSHENAFREALERNSHWSVGTRQSRLEILNRYPFTSADRLAPRSKAIRHNSSRHSFTLVRNTDSVCSSHESPIVCTYWSVWTQLGWHFACFLAQRNAVISASPSTLKCEADREDNRDDAILPVYSSGSGIYSHGNIER